VRGHDGAGLHEVGGTTFSLGLGTSLAGVGDADNDGVPDYAAGAPRAKHPLTLQTIGRVEVRSGAGGGVLRSSTGERVGGAVGGGDDVDGDGLPDVAAGGPDLDGAGLVDHGFARVLSSRAAGTTHFGAGTPGCAGPQLLTAADVAAVGATFELRCSGVAPNTFGTLLASTGSNPVGVDVGFGALIHVDLFGVFLLEALPSPSGSHGSFAVPIPNDPGLAGFTFHAQEGFLWAPGCAAIPLGLSSSNGLSVTIQP
jgi:hypothetical protein